MLMYININPLIIVITVVKIYVSIIIFKYHIERSISKAKIHSTPKITQMICYGLHPDAVPLFKLLLIDSLLKQMQYQN